MSGGAEVRAPDWFAALVALFLLSFPGTLVLAFLHGLGAVPEGPTNGPAWIQLNYLLQGLNCLLVIAWLRIHPRRPPRGHASGWSSIGLYLLFMAAWIPFVAYGYSWLLEILGESLEPQAHLVHFVHSDLGQPELWASLIVVVLVGPVAEEIVFRGYLYGALESTLGARNALLLTAAVFGLIHGLQYALPLGLLGLFFGWLRERNGGLAAPIMVHILHNSLTVAAVVLVPSLLEQVGQR